MVNKDVNGKLSVEVQRKVIEIYSVYMPVVN